MNASDYLALAQAHSGKREYEQALDAFLKSLELDQDNASAWHGMGNAFHYLGEYEEALVAFEQGLQRFPEDALLWFAKGLVFRELWQIEAALEAFEHGLRYEPDDSKAWTIKGNLLTRLGRGEEARLAYQQAVELNQEDHEPLTGIGNLLLGEGQFKQAAEAFQKSLNLLPENPDALFGMGTALMESGHPDAAIEAFDPLIRNHPDFPNGWLGKGRALMLKNAPYEAWRMFLRFEDLAESWYARSYVPYMLEVSHPQSVPWFRRRLLESYAIGRFGGLAPDFERLKTISEGVDASILLYRANAGDAPVWEFYMVLGLMYYYMGDPVQSYDILGEEALDEDFGDQLQVHYYLILSSLAFYEDFDADLEDALELAEFWLENEVTESGAQPYYAGMLFLLSQKEAEAIRCFRQIPASDEHLLPGMMMQALAMHRLLERGAGEVNQDSILNLVEQILKLDANPAVPGGSLLEGFRLDPEVALAADFKTAVMRFARFRELEPAIRLVHDYLDQNQALRDTYTNPPLPAFPSPGEVWKMTTDLKQTWDEYFEQEEAVSLQSLRESLESEFLDYPALEPVEGLGIDLNVLGKILQKQQISVNKAQGLIVLYFLIGKIRVQEKLMLHAFAEWRYALKSEERLSAETFIATFLEQAFRWTASDVAGDHFSGKPRDPGLAHSMIELVAGTGFLGLLVNFLYFTLEQPQDYSWEQFKQGFEQFVDRIRQDLGEEEFEERFGTVYVRPLS